MHRWRMGSIFDVQWMSCGSMGSDLFEIQGDSTGHVVVCYLCVFDIQSACWVSNLGVG